MGCHRRARARRLVRLHRHRLLHALYAAALLLHIPQERVASPTDSFLASGLPDAVHLTRSRLAEVTLSGVDSRKFLNRTLHRARHGRMGDRSACHGAREACAAHSLVCALQQRAHTHTQHSHIAHASCMNEHVRALPGRLQELWSLLPSCGLYFLVVFQRTRWTSPTSVWLMGAVHSSNQSRRFSSCDGGLGRPGSPHSKMRFTWTEKELVGTS